VIEVPVLDAPQRPLADPVIEQQPQRDPIPKVIVSGSSLARSSGGIVSR
jgi:hypothetical protein